jgi:hypothetical protein
VLWDATVDVVEFIGSKTIENKGFSEILLRCPPRAIDEIIVPVAALMLKNS